MNAPDRFELFQVPEGKSKLTMAKDTKIPDAATFTFEAEDHTLGNILRMQLLQDPNVLFAGYRVPHPLEHKFILKIQTRHNTSPEKALETAINSLKKELEIIKKQFKDEVQRVRPAGNEF